MLIIPRRARELRMRAFVRTAASVHLFTNDVEPNGETLASYLVEPPAASGYAPFSLAQATWDVAPIVDAKGRPGVRATAPPARWTLTQRGLVVRGQFVVDQDGALLWAERFDEPFEVLRVTDELEVVSVLDNVDIDPEATP